MKTKQKRGRPKVKRRERLISRTFGATDKMWGKIEELAEKEGVSAAEIVRRILDRQLKDIENDS